MNKKLEYLARPLRHDHRIAHQVIKRFGNRSASSSNILTDSTKKHFRNRLLDTHTHGLSIYMKNSNEVICRQNDYKDHLECSQRYDQSRYVISNNISQFSSKHSTDDDICASLFYTGHESNENKLRIINVQNIDFVRYCFCRLRKKISSSKDALNISTDEIDAKVDATVIHTVPLSVSKNDDRNFTFSFVSRKQRIFDQ